MASTKEYLDFVMEQLSGLDEVSSRAMMGEYILYYRGRIFGGVYEDWRLSTEERAKALAEMMAADKILYFLSSCDRCNIDQR